jgi:hypothetical protein
MYVAPPFPKLLPPDKAVLGERATATFALEERTIASQRLHNAQRLRNGNLRFPVHANLKSGGLKQDSAIRLFPHLVVPSFP